jgi:hypothetical protein
VKRLGLVAPLAACVTLAATLVSDDVNACGGCFIPPTDPTVVTGHRMALAVSPDQTVLWDQIQYAGDPADFAWVLPVKTGAYIEVASDAWFETLEALTTVQVVQPPVTCDQPFSPGCGAAQFDAAAGEGTGSGGPAVDILHRGTVGPYETLTLGTDTPGALNDWLSMNNYNVDPTTQPIIDAYVAEGFDFIALRLQPDKGVREMKPVRVVTPGASPVLPLRMVGIGTGANVAITLYVIGEGRWEADNFANALVPQDLVAWDFTTSKSNYAELRKQTLESTNGGLAWLTAYAQQGALLSPTQGSFFFNSPLGSDPNGFPLDTFAEGFLNQGIENKETVSAVVQTVDEQACRDAFQSLEASFGQSGALVENPCPAGLPLSDPTCGMVDPNETDARQFTCGALDDLAVALVGSHPRDVWITRLEAELPRAGLATDLILRAAAKQEPLSNYITARVAVNAEEFCGSFVAPKVWPTRGIGGPGALMGFSLAVFAFAAALARRLAKAS